MFRRPRILVVAAATLLGWLLTASAASAKVPGVAGGGGMFGILGLPSVNDIISRIVKGIFGALAKALMPGFIREAPDKIVTWLATLPNPTQPGSDVYALMQTTRATAIAFLFVVLLQGVVRGMIPGDHDHPVQVLSRVLGVGFFLALYEWLFANVVALFNTIAVGLLHNPIVKRGMEATVERTFAVESISSPMAGLLVLFALLTLIGLLLVKLMLIYLLPMVFVAWPLLSPLSVPRETSHIPKAMGALFGALCAIPAGWALLFAVAGALSSDMASGRVDGGAFLANDMLAPLTTIGVFALAVWWPFALLGMAKSLPGQFGLTGGRGPVERASSIGGTAARLKLAAMAASGGTGALAGAKLGAAGAGPRLASDGPRTTGRRAGAAQEAAGPGAARARGTAAPGSSPSAIQEGAAGPPEPAGQAAASQSPATSRRDTQPHASGPGRAPADPAPSPGPQPSPAERAGDDPLSPSAGEPKPSGLTPGQRSRDASRAPTPGIAAHGPRVSEAPRRATDAPSESPPAHAERPAAAQTANGPARPPQPAAAPPSSRGGSSSSRPAPSPDAPPFSPAPAKPQRPGTAPARAREAVDVPQTPPVPTAQAPSVGGLPPSTDQTAREAFGKEPS